MTSLTYASLRAPPHATLHCTTHRTATHRTTPPRLPPAHTYHHTLPTTFAPFAHTHPHHYCRTYLLHTHTYLGIVPYFHRSDVMGMVVDIRLAGRKKSRGDRPTSSHTIPHHRAASLVRFLRAGARSFHALACNAHLAATHYSAAFVSIKH